MPLSRFTLKFAPLLTWYRTSIFGLSNKRVSKSTAKPPKHRHANTQEGIETKEPTRSTGAPTNRQSYSMTIGRWMTVDLSTSNVNNSLSYSHLACHAIHHQSPHSVVGSWKLACGFHPTSQRRPQKSEHERHPDAKPHLMVMSRLWLNTKRQSFK